MIPFVAVLTLTLQGHISSHDLLLPGMTNSVNIYCIQEKSEGRN